ncbi:DUF1800 domain-containing protein [Chitinophagales bacterium]|nr:DUF1800 domain-containing protein [Chitinophagales bacterium]
MQIRFLLGICAVLCLSVLQAQVYEDHFGAGHDVGVSVSSSSSESSDPSANSINGTGVFPDLPGASRFLSQAGFGGTYEEIEYLTQVGIDQWLDEQFAVPYTSYYTDYTTTYNEVEALINTVHTGAEIAPSREYIDFVFWKKTMQESDVLRNKAAFALHQIFVLSTRSIKLKDTGFSSANYYDILYEGAFGNFRDILGEVTLHPIMGYYLSHLQNEKANPVLGTLPDENYAREVMQLFTIGLFELNNDGTRKVDENGEFIPTYDIGDVQEMAKVFTGLSGGAYNLVGFPELEGQTLAFDKSLNRYDGTVPMIMYDDFHEPGQKVMVDGSVLPAGQPGMQDVDDALDILFNHPNTGPFISYRLIQQMVKSNPSPAYVNRVATVFSNNGQGVRGDMRAVFKALLSDPEARDCSYILDPSTGKLRQPLERMIHLSRAFNVDSPSGKIWTSNYKRLFDDIEQVFMGAPSVFNFFTPFYAEEEIVKPAGLVSPEFQIMHSVTAISFLNLMEDGIKNRPFRNQTTVNPNSPKLTNNNADDPFLDYSDEIAIVQGPDGNNALVDRLNIILCHGELTEGSKNIIVDALDQLDDANATFTAEDKVHNAIYFITAAADYTILR